MNIYLYRVFCNLKLQYFKIIFEMMLIKQIRSKDNIEISAVTI